MSWTSTFSGMRSLFGNPIRHVLWTTALCLTVPALGQVQRGRVDTSSLKLSAQNLEKHIVTACEAGGVDVSRQSVHLRIAFSTSHWGVDPLAGEAERELAVLSAKEFLVSGDKFSTAAWEMDLWSSPNTQKPVLSLTTRGRDSEGELRSRLPLTAEAGSGGGHDTERSIVSLGEDADRSLVVILLANNMATVGRKGHTLLGSNAASYVASLENRWWRTASVNKRGASIELPYEVVLGTGERRQRVCDATILVSRSFETNELSDTRSKLQQAAVEPSEDNPVPRPADMVTNEKPVNAPPDATPLFIVLALAGLGAAAWYFLRKTDGGGGLVVLKIDGVTQPVSATQLGTGVYLAGDAYSGPLSPSVRSAALGNHAVARIMKEGAALVVTAMPGYSIRTEGDGADAAAISLTTGEQRKIKVSLPQESESFLTSGSVDAEVQLELDR